MKIILRICLLVGFVSFVGCSGAGSADVEGKPALKNPPESEAKKSISEGMAMDPTKMMLNMFDKNGDGVIDAEEMPDGRLDDYDADQDGKITTEELVKRNKEISSKGLEAVVKDPDKDEKVRVK